MNIFDLVQAYLHLLFLQLCLIAPPLILSGKLSVFESLLVFVQFYIILVLSAGLAANSAGYGEVYCGFDVIRIGLEVLVASFLSVVESIDFRRRNARIERSEVMPYVEVV